MNDTRRSPKTSVELVIDARAQVAEGPVWHGDVLWWVDILGGAVHRYDPGNGCDRAFAIGQAVGALVPRRRDGFMLALRDGFATWDGPGALAMLVAPVERDDVGNRMNDGKCDRQGRFWASTMAFDAAEGRGAMYRLDRDFTTSCHLRGLTIGNGLAWSADDTLLYYIDSHTGGIDVIDFDAEEGALRNRRPFIDVCGSQAVAPDGMTIDADGCLWVAVFGGAQVRRYTPQGALDHVIELPVSNVTACTFGGQDYGDLYITTAWHTLDDARRAAQPHAGGVFVCRPGVTGLPPSGFGG